MAGLNPTIYTTQTSPAWKCTLKNDSEAADPSYPNSGATYPVTDLTGLVGANIQAYFKPTGGGAGFSGAGSFQILSNKNPTIVLYQPNSADVQSAGSYNFFVIVTFPNGPDFFGPYALTITQK